MEKVIVYDNPKTGRVSVVVPSGQTQLSLDEIAAQTVPSGVAFRIVEKDKLPEDRYFRDAWTDENPTDTVDIDLEKARAVHMQNIRQARNEKLKKLDIDTLRGVDNQPEKQILRDIPQNFDLSEADNPEDLKNLWPEELKDLKQ